MPGCPYDLWAWSRCHMVHGQPWLEALVATWSSNQPQPGSAGYKVLYVDDPKLASQAPKSLASRERNSSCV
jgi:hypothetical protein